MIDLSLHQAQAEVFSDPHRMRALVAGRRLGKTRLVQWELVRASLSFPGTIDPQSPQVVLGVLPTLKQARGILWEPLVSLFETKLAAYCRKIDRTNFTIYPHDGKPPIIISGANDGDGDRLRGKRIYFIACDEYQDWKPSIFSTVVRPAMADTEGSRAIFTGTPKGKLNHLFKLFLMPKKHPNVYRAFSYPTSANITIPNLEQEIAQARLELPPRLFRQEWEASFEDFEGKIFSELDAANLIPARLLPGTCWMGIDWGDVNPAIVVWRRVPSGSEMELGLPGSVSKEVWVYEEGWQGNFSLEGQGGQPITTPTLHKEIVRLARKYNVQGVYCDPSRPASILEVRSLGQSSGCLGLTRAVEGNNTIQDGLDYLHSLIFQKRLLIATGKPKDNRWVVSGEEFYELASAYHRAKNKDGGIVEEVEEGQNDHCLDASRYTLMPIMRKNSRYQPSSVEVP